MARLPVISGDEAIRAFQRAGWVVRRQAGSHVALDKEGEVATLSVPTHREVVTQRRRGAPLVLPQTGGPEVRPYDLVW